MNEAGRWRYVLAQKIAPFYRANPKVCLVEVGGSVSRGCADRYSDIELGIFWSAAPSEAERSAVVGQLGGDDVAQAKAWFAHRRQVWDQAPDDLLM